VESIEQQQDQKLALIAESLYLINLLLLPGLAYIVLFIFYRKTLKNPAHTIAISHFSAAFKRSNWAGVFIFATILMVWLGGVDSATAWVIAIIYFTVVHSTFILLGVLGISQAFSGK